MSWLSDRHRGKVALAAGAVLLALMAGWTRHAVNNPDPYWAAIDAPAAWDGAPVVLTLMPVVEIVDERHWVSRKGADLALVEGDTTDLRVGDDVSVGGRFRAADSHVVAEWQEVAALRPGKRRLGLAAMGFLLVALPFWYTIRGGRVVERG